jgi:hypothetical protein
MKKLFLSISKGLIFVGFIFNCSSCSKEDYSDSEVTITTDIGNSGSVTIAGVSCLIKLTSDNLELELWIDDSNFSAAYFGKVNGLEDIKTLPVNNFGKSIDIIEKGGYVFKDNKNKTYSRVFVSKLKTNTNGNIEGAELKYQSTWNP